MVHAFHKIVTGFQKTDPKLHIINFEINGFKDFKLL